MNGWPHQAQHRYTQASALDDPVVHLLRSLVDMLQEVGVYLSFDYCMESTYEVLRLFVGPNYTVKEVCYDVYIHALNQRERGARDAELVANASGVMILYQVEVVSDNN
jgi:recombinational DNA repair protein (RecF pathway)